MVKAGRTDLAAWCRSKAKQLIRGSVLLDLDAQIEEAKAKQAQLGEAKLLGAVNDDAEAISNGLAQVEEAKIRLANLPNFGVVEEAEWLEAAMSRGCVISRQE